MTAGRSPADRAARLGDWEHLAAVARAAAADPAAEPTPAVAHLAEAAGLWAWPTPGMMRCRALRDVMRIFVQARAAERAAMAPGLDLLAVGVAAGVADARETMPLPRRADARLPYREN